MSAQEQNVNAFLAGLASTEFGILRSHLVPTDLRAGDRLHYVGEPVDEVTFPHSGVVVMTMACGDDHGEASLWSAETVS